MRPNQERKRKKSKTIEQDEMKKIKSRSYLSLKFIDDLIYCCALSSVEKNLFISFTIRLRFYLQLGIDLTDPVEL